MTTNQNQNQNQTNPHTVCKCGDLLDSDYCPTCGRSHTEGRPFTPGGIDAVLVGPSV